MYIYIYIYTPLSGFSMAMFRLQNGRACYAISAFTVLSLCRKAPEVSDALKEAWPRGWGET